jgi:hypothetical protein
MNYESDSKEPVKDQAIYLTPANQYPINKIYAWLSRDAKGNEGILSMLGSDGPPLVFSTPGLIARTEPHIDLMREQFKGQYTFHLAEFERIK